MGRSKLMPQMQQYNGSGPHRRYIVGLKGGMKQPLSGISRGVYLVGEAVEEGRGEAL